MARQTFKTCLIRVIDELNRDGWPSEDTLADVCRLLGRTVPKPLNPGHTISLLEAAVQPDRKFKP